MYSYVCSYSEFLLFKVRDCGDLEDWGPGSRPRHFYQTLDPDSRHSKVASSGGVSVGTKVSIKYGGQLGNNMFQYAFGYRLASEIAARTLKAVSLSAPKMPLSWAGMRNRVILPPGGDGGRRLAPSRRPAGKAKAPKRGHVVSAKGGGGDGCATVTDRDRFSTTPLCAQLEGALERTPSCVAVNGFFEDFGHLRGWREELRDVFAPAAGQCRDLAPAAHEVLIHVRECDHGDVDSPRPFFSAHGQVPWKYYATVVTGLKRRAAAAGAPTPKFTVLSPPSCKGSPLLNRLEKDLNARLRKDSTGATDDYCFMLRAKTIVLAPSTFSFWCAWFSDAQVHFPMLGVFAHQRTINYPLGPNKAVPKGLRCEALFENVGKSVIVDEPRYVYHDVDSNHYFGTYHRTNESFTWHAP